MQLSAGGCTSALSPVFAVEFLPSSGLSRDQSCRRGSYLIEQGHGVCLIRQYHVVVILDGELSIPIYQLYYRGFLEQF